MWYILYRVGIAKLYTYVGQTCRQLATQVEEHWKVVTKCDVATSAIAEHVWSDEH